MVIKEVFKELKDLYNMDIVNKVLFWVIIVVIIFVVIKLASATPVIIDPNQNPFLNYTNTTNQTNNTIDIDGLTEEQIRNIIGQYINNSDKNLTLELLAQLIGMKNSNLEERALLDAVIKSFERTYKNYQDTLENNDAIIQDMKQQRDEARTERDEIKLQYTKRVETLETEVEGLRGELTKTQGLGLFWVVMGIFCTVVVFEVGMYVRHNQRTYFIWRWVRDKIPIKF